jgi:DNA repair protein RecN (Recombination protein N)
MLLELRVENYAIVDHLAVEFAPGLNLLTGETGAGKSILIDALALLLGEKASPEAVRHGAEKAVLSAVFRAEGTAADAILEANGLDAESADGELILRREIAVNGRGRVFVNNQPATVAVLKQLAPALGTIHAQNESLLAFDAAARLALLDSAAGCDFRPVANCFQNWRSLRDRIGALEHDEQDRLRMVDLWSFQKKEIDAAHLQPEEDERLEAEKRLLANAEKVHTLASAGYDLLYEGESSAAASLRAAARHLQELARYESRWEEQVAALESARIAAEDVGLALRDFAEEIHASPERLAEIEDRLALMDRLKRKYGKTLAEAIAYGEEVTRKLHEVENKDEVVKDLRQQLAIATTQYLASARELSEKRRSVARKLEKLVEQQVNELAMKAHFHIELTRSEDSDHWTEKGFDEVSYLISANPGEPLGPVEKIASGGELSRVMLALKTAMAQPSRKPDKAAQRTLVFDEIDTGIGGRAAEAVGRKLKKLAESAQVLCITHLPQIAAFADHHYAIEKKEVRGRTQTSIRRLDPAERTQEVARMLSGAQLTETSLRHAEQMLNASV